MIAAALIGTIGLAATLAGALIWQVVRNSNIQEKRLKEVSERFKLVRRVDAQAEALDNHSKAIESLESTLARETARSQALQGQLRDAHDLLFQVKPNEVGHALRAALARYQRMLQVPEAEEADTTSATDGD